MSQTPRLGLAEIAQNQASKYVTHNEALATLDALVAPAVEDRDLDAPPSSPAEGALYIVGFASWAVAAVDTSNNVVEISGDETARIGTGDSFQIAGSTGNDGGYSVSAVTYNSTSGNTEITTNESVDDGTADGEVRHADGTWNGHIHEIAQFYNGAWRLYAPIAGMAAFLLDEGFSVTWSPSAGDWTTYSDAPVDSVNGQVGTVVLDTDDIGEGSTNLYHTAERVRDVAAAALAGSTDVSVSHDDANDTITIALTGLSQFDTGSLSEGTNLYYTDERVHDAVNALLTAGTNIAITYDDANDTLTIDGPAVPVDSVAGKTGAVTLDASDVSLGSVLNAAQVVNAGGTPRILSDTEANRPAAGTTGRLFVATDTRTIYRDTGSAWEEIGGTGVDVEDGGTAVLSPATGLDFGTDLAVTDNGDGTVSIDFTGGTGVNATTVTASESGSVAAATIGIVAIDHLADTETLSIDKAALLLADGQPAPSGLDLEIHTMDNAGATTSRVTAITGDGATVHDDQTGSPLASYQNTSGAGQTVAVVVNNTTGASQSIYARVQGSAG